MKSTNFIDNSNARNRQMQRIKDLQDVQSVYKRDPNTKVCKNHLTSIWGKDQWGNFYTRCAAGNRLNESCEELEEDDDYVSR